MSREIEAPIAVGWHAAFAALRAGDGNVREIWLRQGREDARGHDLRALAEEHRVPLRTVDADALDARVPGLRHQGVIVFLRDARIWDEDQLAGLLDALQEPPFLLVLDGVQDPHNL